MKKSNLEVDFDELSKQLNCDVNTIKKLYRELNTKKCTEYGDFDQLLDCLYSILLEKRIIESKKNNSNDSLYTSTDDFAINKAMLEIYGDLSLDDLSDEYIYYMTSKENKIIIDNQIKHTF